MANILYSFIPFPEFLELMFVDVGSENLLRVLSFCRRFPTVKVPDAIYLGIQYFSRATDLASLPNLKSLDFSSL